MIKKTSVKNVLIGILLLIGIVAAYFFNQVSNSKLQTYTNESLNFSIRFPKEINPLSTFTTYYTLSGNWRAEASEMSTGTPIVAIPIFSVDDSQKSPKERAYPLYYRAEVRVGVSTDVAHCYDKDAGYENQEITDVKINGVPFKRFAFGGAAMMHYQNGLSYRTIHDNKCYAVEQLRAGSTYKDEDTLPGISEETLTDYYNQGDAIVKSFTFLK